MQISQLRDIVKKTIDFICNEIETNFEQEKSIETHHVDAAADPNDLQTQKARALLKKMGIGEVVHG